MHTSLFGCTNINRSFAPNPCTSPLPLSYLSRVGCLYALCTAAFLSYVAHGGGKVLYILFRYYKQLQILLFKTYVDLRFACLYASNIFTTIKTRTGLGGGLMIYV